MWLIDMASYISRVVGKPLLGKQNQECDSCCECAFLVTLGARNDDQSKRYSGMKPLAQFWIIHLARDSFSFGRLSCPGRKSDLDGVVFLCVFLITNCLTFLLDFLLKETKQQKQTKNEVV